MRMRGSLPLAARTLLVILKRRPAVGRKRPSSVAEPRRQSAPVSLSFPADGLTGTRGGVALTP
jgi:hypothetical protein